jgi:hypothetical protein
MTKHREYPIALEQGRGGRRGAGESIAEGCGRSEAVGRASVCGGEPRRYGRSPPQLGCAV